MKKILFIFTILFFSMFSILTFGDTPSWKFNIEDTTGYMTPTSISLPPMSVAQPALYPYPIYQNMKETIIWQNGSNYVAYVIFNINGHTSYLYFTNGSLPTGVTEIANSPINGDGYQWHIGVIDHDGILSTTGAVATSVDGVKDGNQDYYGADIKVVLPANKKPSKNKPNKLKL